MSQMRRDEQAETAVKSAIFGIFEDGAIDTIDVRPGDFATQFHSSMQHVGADLAGAYAPGLEHAWRTVDRNMGIALEPQTVADALLAMVEGRRRGPVVALGSAFQARIAPVLARLSPRAWVQWGQRQYYGLRRGP